MNRSILRLLSLLLAALTFLTACTPTASPDVTVSDTTVSATSAEDTTAEAQAPVREVYEDLSNNVPERTGADGKSATVTAKGELTAPDVVLEFDGESGLFAVSSNIVNIHDTATCDGCGFTGNGDYLLSCHGEKNTSAGFTVTLATPIHVSTVTGLTVTYRTSGEAVSSEIRVMTHDSPTMSDYENECPSLGGAVETYKTLDVNVTDFNALADDEGMLSSFQIYFRNKDRIDCSFRTITVRVNPEKLLTVTEIEGNYFSRGDVTRAIAETIAARFEYANMGAEIKVEVDRYRQNNSKMDGGIDYVVTATLNDGSVITGGGKVVIPYVEGVWLDTTSGSFGASHDNLGQWQETFDPSGMVLLTANPISAKEGIETAQYALIPAEGSYDDPDVVWRTPHLLEMNGGGIETLFVNAWLDHAHTMTEGARYRLLVRGVTTHGNYVLHLDIPFTYSPLETLVTAKLTAALATLNGAEFICPADTADKTAYVTDQLAALLGDGELKLVTELLGEGVNSTTVRVTVLSSASVTADRLPAYTVKGTPLTSVYAFEGDAMTSEILNFPCQTYEGSIQLLSPFDGEPGVVTASPEIYALWNATIEEIQSGKYPFKRGENCLPIPAELIWEDEGAAGKTYTVTVSTNRDLSNPIVLEATECKTLLYDTQVGETYYWQVSDGESVSQLFTFTTSDAYSRFFALEGVSNFRDIGGYLTKDGKRVKRGMAYRSAYLNDASAEAKDYMVNTLGIKVELDLRGSGAATFGKEVERKVIAMQWYSHIFSTNNYEVVRQTVSAFAYPENYPLNFHCAVGRDRTGTTSFLILGLLGVEEDVLLHEYYGSFYSDMASCDKEEFLQHIANVKGLMEGLKRYAPKGTLQDQIEAYLLTIGVTEAEIASIRNILLEDA